MVLPRGFVQLFADREIIMSKEDKQFPVKLDKTTLLEKGQLQNGKIFQLVLLDPTHTSICHSFHHAIVKHMSKAEQSFILDKPQSYFSSHLTPGNTGKIIGIVVDGRLAGQAIIHNPTTQNPETGMVDMKLPDQPENLSVLQAVSIDPGFRGQGLMNKLVSSWIRESLNDNRKYLVAEIETGNIASWKSFLTGGLNIVSLGRDPGDGTIVYNACEKTAIAAKRQLTPEFNRASKMPEIACPLEKISEQKNLFQKGYQAVGYNATRKALAFRRLDI